MEIVRIKSFSDGDATTWPEGAPYSAIAPDIYLQKVALMWMEERGEAVKGAKYVLDRLPDGYKLYDKPRKTAEIRDKYLFGHPRGKPFDSPAQFFKHFKCLMTTTSSTLTGCSCKLCEERGQKRSEDSSKAVKLSERAATKAALSALDVLVQRLSTEGSIREAIRDPRKIDWGQNQGLARPAIERTVEQDSFVPRQGEVVLFIREMKGVLRLDHATKSWRIQDTETHQWLVKPFHWWEAGVVAEAVHSSDTLLPEDLGGVSRKRRSVAWHGCKIEGFPDPCDGDKRWTFRYKYVPARQIRPLTYWAEFLRGTPVADWHPTIKHAIRLFSTLSMVQQHSFAGTWPQATISCGGIWLGAELILVGDAVIVAPEQGQPADTVIVVQKICLLYTDLDKPDDFRERVRLAGTAYTTSASKASSPAPIVGDDRAGALPRGMRGWTWYHAHDPARIYRASVDRVMGRCHEAEATMLWFERGEPSLSLGLAGTRGGRAFSSAKDNRKAEGQGWVFADSRSEQLAVQNMNLITIPPEDGVRNPALRADMLRRAHPS